LAAAKAKIKVARNIRFFSTCPPTGNCIVIAAWNRPQNYNAATDTATIHWEQTAPGVFPELRRAAPKGTADTLSILRPADGKTKQGLATLCYGRKAVNEACNTPAAWSVTADMAPVDTATNFKVTKLDIKPDTAKVTNTVDAAGKVIKKGEQQFCMVIHFGDSKVALMDQYKSAVNCVTEYNKFASSKRAVTAEQQIIANGVCFTWSTDDPGGSITPHICNTVGWMRQYLPPGGLLPDTTVIEVQNVPEGSLAAS
jgi:hypothetical protein